MAVTGGRDLALRGVGVVVTRDDAPDFPLTRALEALGARVLYWPTIRPAPPLDAGPLEDSIERLAEFDWAAFTSPRAVEAVARRRRELPPELRVAVVGWSTGEWAGRHGWRVDVLPERQTAESLVAELDAAGLARGDRVFFPASEIARPTLEAGLARLGAEVVRVTAYRTLPAELDRAACRRAIEAGQAQVISLTSPSSLENLRRALGEELFGRACGGAVMAAIGPTTAAAVRESGCAQVIEASDHSLSGLVRRIAEWAGDTSHRRGDELSS